MDRLENVATPVTAATVAVPDSVPPPGLAPIATVMLAVRSEERRVGKAWTVTCTAGAIAKPAVALVGWTVKASLDAAAGVPSNAHAVAPVSAADAAVSV